MSVDAQVHLQTQIKEMCVRILEHGDTLANINITTFWINGT